MQRWVSLRGENVSHEMSEEYHGVGFIKSESIGLSSGYSPFIAERLAVIQCYIDRVCSCFSGKSVFYRLNCHSSLTMNHLIGTYNFLYEKSPFLGAIGARRYLKFPDESRKEFEILAKLSEKHGNLNILIPYIHDVHEYHTIRERLYATGFVGKVGIMLEIPSSLLTIGNFIEAGCINFLIGSNDLTQLVLGVARYEPSVENVFNRSHEAVLKLIENSLDGIDRSKCQIGATGYLTDVDLDIYQGLGLDFISYYL